MSEPELKRSKASAESETPESKITAFIATCTDEYVQKLFDSIHSDQEKGMWSEPSDETLSEREMARPKLIKLQQQLTRLYIEWLTAASRDVSFDIDFYKASDASVFIMIEGATSDANIALHEPRDIFYEHKDRLIEKFGALMAGQAYWGKWTGENIIDSTIEQLCGLE